MSGGEVSRDLNAVAARWEHGHPTLTPGCELCNGEYEEVRRVLDGRPCGCPTCPHCAGQKSAEQAARELAELEEEIYRDGPD